MARNVRINRTMMDFNSEDWRPPSVSITIFIDGYEYSYGTHRPCHHYVSDLHSFGGETCNLYAIWWAPGVPFMYCEKHSNETIRRIVKEWWFEWWKKDRMNNILRGLRLHNVE